MQLLKGMLEVDGKERVLPHEALMSDYLSLSAKHGSPVPTIADEAG